ncbi:MAG: UvrB/UvrC motif-containing protein [bacterium]
MNCDNCGDPDASIHKIHVSDNEIKHVQLCESCAKEESVKDTESTQGVGEFFSDLQERTAGDSESTCPNCGLTLKELKKTNKVGCRKCYSVFREEFESIVHRIHGADQHIGDGETTPQSDSTVEDAQQEAASTGLGKVSREQKLQLLEKRLQKRVDEEDYEAAADLRDRIQELKDGSTNEPTN